MLNTIILISHYKEAQAWVNQYLTKRKVQKIAYIMDAKKPRLATDPDYFFHDKDNFEKAGFVVDFIDLEKTDPLKLEEILSQYQALYLKGGNSFVLLNSIKISGFDRIIQKLLGKGIIYVGESAGAYVACPTIEMASWKHQDRNILGLTDLSALNLVPYLISAHYTEEFKPIMDVEIPKCRYKVKLLTDQDLIIIENGQEIQIKL